MAGRLAGKVALVTGAAGGIGAAAVRLFCAEGASLCATDIDAEGLEAAAPAGIDRFPADLTRSADVESLLRHVEETFGRLDVLFNVAGASGRKHGDGPVDRCTEAGWDWTLNVNLRSVFLCCKHAIPLMRKGGGGSIINVSSVLALSGHPQFDTHAYAAAKGAILSLSRAMAASYAADRIRANVICPGLIRTGMSQRAQEDAGVRALLPDLQPLTSDFGEPEDVAAAALYLASDEGRFLTGVVLPVDGGWMVR